MDRTIFWSQNQSRTFDLVEGDHDVLLALGTAVQDVLNSTTTVLSGFAGTQTTVPSLTINLAAGRIYQQAPADATANGAIPQDNTVITQQGFLAASQVTLSTAGITTGQSRWALIEAQYSQVDSIRTADPNGGLLFFYNSANPNEPFQGPGNDGDTTPTVRQGVVVVQVVLGSAATTGSETPPNPTSGWVPMYLVDLSYGQTAITSGQILTAGPSVGTGVPNNYPYAPFLAGLLNSHHSGNAGQAPKINLATETQGTLPVTSVANLYATDSGTVNALAVGYSPAPGSLSALQGLLLKVKVANTNTSTTPTINVNGLGAVTIVSTDLTPLQPGELFAGGISQLIYDGTYFQLQGTTANGEITTLNNQVYLYFADSGTVNALSCSYVPTSAPTGMIFRIKVAYTNTSTTPTFALSGGAYGAVIINNDSSPLVPGELLAGSIVLLIYDGTHWQLQSRNQPPTYYGVDTGSTNAIVVSGVEPPIQNITGQLFSVKIANTTTSTTPTLTFGGFGPDTIVNNDLTPLLPGQLVAGGVYQFIQDGTYMQLQSSPTEHRGFSNFLELTGSGNFTVPAGVFKIKATAIGAGGAGGGTAATGSSTYAAGSGGNSGTWCTAFMSVTPGQVISYSCGAVALGAAGANGNAGGTTTFGSLTAPGGNGGNVGAAASLGELTYSAASFGTASGGNLNFGETQGAFGFTSASGAIVSGAGGGGYFNAGGPQQGSSGGGGNGFNAMGNGSGGGGAAAAASQGAYAGGVGGGGCVLVEY